MMGVTGFRTCTPSSIPGPEKVETTGVRVGRESVSEANEPAYLEGIFQTGQGQNVVFERGLIRMVTVQTSWGKVVVCAKFFTSQYI